MVLCLRKLSMSTGRSDTPGVVGRRSRKSLVGPSTRAMRSRGATGLETLVFKFDEHPDIVLLAGPRSGTRRTADDGGPTSALMVVHVTIVYGGGDDQPRPVCRARGLGTTNEPRLENRCDRRRSFGCTRTHLFRDRAPRRGGQVGVDCGARAGHRRSGGWIHGTRPGTSVTSGVVVRRAVVSPGGPSGEVTTGASGRDGRLAARPWAGMTVWRRSRGNPIVWCRSCVAPARAG